MIIILTGAGISVESGLRTYRADKGLWEDHKIEDVAHPLGFRRNPDLVNAFYDARYEACQAAAPNGAHLALARLERESTMPVLTITQNIDLLHERAGTKNLLHIHGQSERVICSKCGWLSDEDRLTGHAPCPACMGKVRPDIVWFEELPKHLEVIREAMRQVRIFISIGTSGEVYPAAGLVKKAAKRKAWTVECNTRQTGGFYTFKQRCLGPATSTVPDLVESILQEGEDGPWNRLRTI